MTTKARLLKEEQLSVSETLAMNNNPYEKDDTRVEVASYTAFHSWLRRVCRPEVKGTHTQTPPKDADDETRTQTQSMEYE